MTATRTGRPRPAAEAKNPLNDPIAANREIEEVLKNTIADYPTPDLPPDDLVLLPAGLLTGQDLTKSVIVRELTGEDEEALARAVQNNNVFHYVDTILEHGTVKIGDTDPEDIRKNLRNLLIGDRDAVLLGIRRATYGDEISIPEWVCPACGELADISMTLEDIPAREMDDPAESSVFTVKLRRGRSARVRLANGHDQAAVFENPKLSQAERDTVLLSRCVLTLTYEDGSERNLAGFPSLARGMSMADRKTILRELAERQPGPRFTDIKHTHGACGKEVSIAVDIGTLFLNS